MMDEKYNNVKLNFKFIVEVPILKSRNEHSLKDRRLGLFDIPAIPVCHLQPG